MEKQAEKQVEERSDDASKERRKKARPAGGLRNEVEDVNLDIYIFLKIFQSPF